MQEEYDIQVHESHLWKHFSGHFLHVFSTLVIFIIDCYNSEQVNTNTQIFQQSEYWILPCINILSVSSL